MLTFFQFVLSEGEVSWTPDYHDPTERKGWMSPKGVAHYFDANDHHAFNPHPGFKKANDKITDHASPKSKDRSEAGRKAITHGLTHGFARFGKKFDTHFVHYDRDAKGGTSAALKALHDLAPSHGERIVISHKPWGSNTKTHEHEFHSPGQAAQHIMKLHHN